MLHTHLRKTLDIDSQGLWHDLPFDSSTVPLQPEKNNFQTTYALNSSVIHFPLGTDYILPLTH